MITLGMLRNTKPALRTAGFLCVFFAVLMAGGVARSQNQPGQNQPGMGQAIAAAQEIKSETPSDSANLSGITPDVDSDADYKLGNGDHVRIDVFGQKDLSDTYEVDGLGRITFPLIGQINARGLTAKQLSQKIASALSPDFIRNPNVSAVVLTHRPFYVIGEVNKPGSYAYVSGISMLNAIALAGGFTYRADEDSFKVQRVNGNGSRTQLDAKPDMPVQPGDVIKVDERIF